MKKLTAVLMISLLLLTAGCGGTSTTVQQPEEPLLVSESAPFHDGYPESYLRLTLDSDMETVDVMMTTTYYMIPMNLYDTLVESSMDDNGQAVTTPALAESWDVSEDGLTYTFHLRKDVRFHNGETLCADDVFYTVLRMMDPQRACANTDIYAVIFGATEYLAGKSDTISGIRVLDDYTISMTLRQSYAPFLSSLASPGGAIYNRKAGDAADQAGGGKRASLFGHEPEYTVGTGPFRLKEWVRGSHVVLERNHDYWKDSVPELAASSSVEGLVFFLLPDTAQLKLQFDSGNLDVFDLDSARSIAAQYTASEEYSDRIYSTTRVGTYYFCLNESVPGLNNVYVRKAIQRGIDRQQLLDSLYFGVGVVANSVLAPGVLGYTQLPAIPYDVDAARGLMEQAGYSSSHRLSLRLCQSEDTPENAVNVNLAVQSMLEQIYIDIEIVSIDSSQWDDLRAAGKLDLYASSWSADFNDPDNFFYTFFSQENSKKRGFYYSNTDVMDHILQARYMTDLDERLELYAQCERQIVDTDAAWVPLFHMEHIFVLSQRIDVSTFHPNWTGWSSMCYYTVDFKRDQP